MSAQRKKRKSPKLIIAAIILYIIVSIVSLYYKPINLRNTSSETVTTEAIVSGNQTIQDLEKPKNVPGSLTIQHDTYELSYNEKYEVANWVAYTIDKEDIYGDASRKDDFRVDPKVPTGSATLADYKGSGYDRGHLLPSAARKATKDDQSETFYMSNMSMQAPSFNRGVWKYLEETVRTFADQNGKVYVVSGPVLTDGPYETLGDDKVAIPHEFYKVVLVYNEDTVKGIGFIIPNEKTDKDPVDFAVSIDTVEDMTHLDFYPNLPDTIEDKVEKDFSINDWNWKTFSTSNGLGFDETADTSDQNNAGQNGESEDPLNKAIYFLNNTMIGLKADTLAIMSKYVDLETLEKYGISIN